MAINKRHINFDYDRLLQKYMDRSITRSERFVLEKRALEDPFVAEAMEGYHYSPLEGRTSSIDKINKYTSEEHRRESGRSTFSLWKIASVAASILLVATIGFYIKGNVQDESKALSFEPMINSEEQPIFASREEEKRDNEINEAISISKEESISAEEVPSPSIQKKIKEESILNNVESQSENDATEELNKDSQSPMAVVVAADPIEETIPRMKIADMQDDNMVQRTKGLSGLKNRMKKERQIVEGSVYSTEQELLIGALVDIKTLDTALLTDINGTFSIDTDSFPLEIDVSYAGFEPTSLFIENKKPVSIFLNPNRVLDEVQITSFESIVPIPQMGEETFKEFIKDNKWMSVLEKKEMIGQVLVGFTIMPSGEVVNVRIINSSCPPCNDRAKWLIESSEKWTNGTDQDINTTYRIEF